jgi:hypothetical protein
MELLMASLQGFGSSLYESLSAQNLVIPYVENALMSDKWPDQFEVPIKKHDSEGDDYFHPSSHAVLGARALYYFLHPDCRSRLAKRTFSSPDILAMMQGTVFHVIVQEKLKVVGLIEDKHIEVPLINKEVHGRGHMDFVFPHHPMTGKDLPVDIKTASPDSFARMFKPSASYEAQLQLYMDWLPTSASEGVILVIEMGRPFRMKEFRIKRNEELLGEIYHRWNYVRECIKTNTIPTEKCCGLDSPTMERCGARHLCRETY